MSTFFSRSAFHMTMNLFDAYENLRSEGWCEADKAPAGQVVHLMFPIDRTITEGYRTIDGSFWLKAASGVLKAPSIPILFKPLGD